MQLNAAPEALMPKRKLRLFGPKVQFPSTLGLQFPPDLLVFAATGISAPRALELRDIETYRAVLAVERSERTGSRLQEASLRSFARAWADLTGVTAFSQISQLDGLRAVFHGQRHKLSPVERRLLVRLAFDSRVMHAHRRGWETPPYGDLFLSILASTLPFWRGCGLQIPTQIALPIDRLLSVLACLDVELAGSERAAMKSPILFLAEASAKPMRHWFNHLLSRTACEDLAQFEQLLLRRRAQLPKGGVISHQLLKHWASTSKLLRDDTAQAFLQPCVPDIVVRDERRRLWCARILSFVAEALKSFATTPVSDDSVRAVLQQRLAQLRSQAERPPWPAARMRRSTVGASIGPTDS